MGCWHHTVTLCQIYTGELPLGQIPQDALYSFIAHRNVRPKRPSRRSCPQLTDEIWLLAKSCWVAEPGRRPIATSVCRTLTELKKVRLAGTVDVPASDSAWNPNQGGTSNGTAAQFGLGDTREEKEADGRPASIIATEHPSQQPAVQSPSATLSPGPTLPGDRKSVKWPKWSSLSSRSLRSRHADSGGSKETTGSTSRAPSSGRGTSDRNVNWAQVLFRRLRRRPEPTVTALSTSDGDPHLEPSLENKSDERWVEVTRRYVAQD